MKKSRIYLIIYAIIMLIIAYFNTFTEIKFLTLNNLPIFLGISWLVLIWLTGYEKDNALHRKETVIIIFTLYLFYNIFIYILGLFIGFERTVYIYKLPNILQNVVIIGSTIIFSELIRYNLLKKGERYPEIIGIQVIIFIVIECFMRQNYWGLASLRDILEFGFTILVVSMLKNVFLTYITMNHGYKPSITYRLMAELSFYVLPIIPKLNVFLATTLNIILPLLLLFFIHNNFTTGLLEEDEERDKGTKTKWIVQHLVLFIVIAFLVIYIVLASRNI